MHFMQLRFGSRVLSALTYHSGDLFVRESAKDFITTRDTAVDLERLQGGFACSAPSQVTGFGVCQWDYVST